MTRLLRFLWLAAVAASLVIGGRSLHARRTAQPRTPFTPRATSDFYLSGLAVERPAESIRQALAQVPADEAVIFAGPPEDPRYFQTLYTVSLLAQPRQVAGLACPAAGGAGYGMVFPDAGQEFTAVLFFQLAPGAAGAQPLAPGLSLVRTPPQEATSPWNSFCSSPPRPSS